MADLNDSSVGFEADFAEAQRLNNDLRVQLEARDAQVEALKGLHEADVKKLTSQVRNLSEQLEEVVKQKIESDKRHQALIDELGIKNRDLNIELNNTIQKYQLELQKQRGSFAKRSSVIAVAMLNKLSHPGPGADDRSAHPSRPPSPSNKRTTTGDDKSTHGASKDNKTNPFKEDAGFRPLQKRPTFGSTPSNTFPTDSRVPEVSHDSVSDDRSAISFGSTRPKESPEKIEDLLLQINPNLPGLSFQNTAPATNANQTEVLRIIEELQYMLKCEEIEKKQILAEHTKTLEKVANLEHSQLDFGVKFFALEREKVEALHQMDIYKNLANDYETKWKDLLVKQSKIEFKMSEIRNDKAMDQGELELLKAEVATLKGKTCDLQLQLNEKDFMETENYREYQKKRAELEQQVAEKEAAMSMVRKQLENVVADNKELVDRTQALEKQLHQASFQVAKAEEIELQYTATIQEMQQTIDKLSRELGLQGVNGGQDALENVSEERLAFSERDSIDADVGNVQGFDRRSHSSVMNNSRDAILGTLSGRSGSVDPKITGADSPLKQLVNSRPNSVDHKANNEAQETKTSRSGRNSILLDGRAPLGLPGTLTDNKPSASQLETQTSLGHTDPRVAQAKETTDINIFSLRKKPEPQSKEPTDKPQDSQAPSKRASSKRFSLVSSGKEALLAGSRRGSVRPTSDILNGLSTQATPDIIRRRMEELNSVAQKEAEWEKTKHELQDQLVKMSGELNKKIEEVFTLEKSLRETQEELNKAREEVRLKSLRTTQLEDTLRESEGDVQTETKKLREQLEEITQSLVDYKLRYNDLQSKSDIQKARLQKQIKIRDFELDILRREIYKFNTNEIEE